MKAAKTLQIFWGDTGVLGYARKHSGADFFAVVEREDNIRPPLAGQGAVRTGLTLDFPPKAKQCANNRLALMEGHCLMRREGEKY